MKRSHGDAARSVDAVSYYLTVNSFDCPYRYHVEFSVPWNVCVHGEAQATAPAIIVENANPNCAVVDFAQDKDGLRCD